MRWTCTRILLWLFGLAMPLSSLATHQVGGQIEMRAVGNTPGHFKIIVTNYLEDGPRAAAQGGGDLGVFRKRDNGLMTTFTVFETSRKPIIFTNEVCAKIRNLKFIVVTFEADVQFSPSTYTDAQGYYISYQTRNRNAGINNISNPVGTGFTFYLEFPALQQSGRAFANSSPRFGDLNGEYICIGDPFTFPFGATDPDGDQLRYSFVTPLNQKGMLASVPGPYPDVVWLSGFGPNNAIPGSPALSIDPGTGQLSVTATQQGLFVFAIKVEEYRNGTKIGEVRRDFQFLVIDCPPATTPNPAIQLQNRPVGITAATICKGDSLLVQATDNPDWNYQWRRDGVNLTNATNASLMVYDAGEYTVLVSLKATCSKASSSQTVQIKTLGSGVSLTGKGHLCATTGSVRLTVATTEPDVRYQWYRDGQPLTGQTADSLSTMQAGRYWAVMTQTQIGCTFRSDSVSITRPPAVSATIMSATGQNRLCPQDSLLLTGSGGVRYVWQKDGQTLTGITSGQYRAKIAGSYSLTATDIDGCEGVSSPYSVVAIPAISVTFDSLPAVCGINAPAYQLHASPPNGEFAGTGVMGTEFSPQRAGIGNHQLTYSTKPAPECAAVVVVRTAIVSPIPTIQLTENITTYRGNNLPITPGLTGNPITFQWSPPTYLDDPTLANPVAVAIASDITYRLDVVNAAGCRASDTVRITVFDQVWVPDAFSPNGDGLNDVWMLAGIDAFPDAIVTIFNRWGEVVYHSEKGYLNPFDGTLNGSSLPAGLYAYTLYTVPEKPVLRGSLMLLR